jgi:hypothetical protein
VAELRHRGTRAVQRMVEHAPSSGGLALWVHHADRDGRVAVPTSAPGPGAALRTDGQTLFYEPAFDALPLPRQTALVAHAVLHVALRHPQRLVQLRARLGDVDAQLFNLCADAIVNSALAHLAWLELPPDAVRLEQLLAESLGQRPDAAAALLRWDVESLYQAIDDRGPAPQQRPDTHDNRAEGQQGDARPDGPQSARARVIAASQPKDLEPAADLSDAPEREAEATREWHERLLRAHAADGAHSMLRALLADLPRLHTPWEQVLRTQLARGLSRQPSLSWSRPARSWLANQGRTRSGRRLPWEPGTSATRPVARLAVVVDVSGSVDKRLLDRFSAELDAISRRHESPLVQVIGDDAVREVRRCDAGHSRLREIRFDGGGGTDFAPLIAEAMRHAPDIVVVLTDLQGPTGPAPRCPVIWAVPPAWRQASAPFGRVLVLQ